MKRLISFIFDYIPEKGTLVEVGCGSGIIANYLSLKLPEIKIIGLDIDTRKIKVAQKTVKNRNNIEFLFQDAVKGIPGCSAVIMSDFLHHLPYEKHETCLKTAFNALDNDGVLIIIEADPVSKPIWRYKLGLCAEFFLYPFSERANCRPPDELEGMLREIGFMVTVIKRREIFARAIFICKKK
ncbi:class I SAM-dependent methyltransferase [bacterium]|nr:class I SAM-dependent methyltransferase [bacterium]